ncbi:ArsR/SmtB family transcription factor [Nonomuraea sp. NPDC050547]|uniref:ArsR/SmtB family transcription factor n=1 Tax=unclassified Nonomuraea TaxID=2593643 RepID=UPI0037AA9597
MNEDRTIADPRALRALAHPIRLALLETLGVVGSATATRCAELIGESVASCSFHLRTLAEYGFIERVSSSTREKPWRLARPVQAVDTAAEVTPMGLALTEVFLEKEFNRVRTWRRTMAAESEEWQEANLIMGATLWMSSAELTEVRELVQSLIVNYLERGEKADLRPEGARPVRLFVASSTDDAPDDDPGDAP